MTEAAIAQVQPLDDVPPAPSRFRRAAWWAAYGAVRLAALAVVGVVLILGVRLRSAAWTWSAPGRFTGDIRNAFNQGNRVLADAMAITTSADARAAPVTRGALFHAFVERFDSVVNETPDEHYSLDYTPARLLIASMWVRSIHQIDPHAGDYRDEYAEPLVRFNTVCELAGAVFMFLLVRHWSRRRLSEHVLRNRVIFGRSDVPWVLGLGAAFILWVNPAMLLDGHMWPQWDVWIVPFYLAAMWLASTERWFAAGAAVAIGALFKGQILMVAPVLLLWPLFGGRWGAAVRAMVGFCFAGAVVVSPWLARNAQAWLWIGAVGLMSVALAGVGRRCGNSRRGWPLWGIIPIAAVVLRPFDKIPLHAGLLAPLLLLAAVVFIPWIARRLTPRGTAVWLAAIMAACIVLSAGPFAGTWSWFSVGFEYPTRHFLVMDIGTNNLAAVLDERFNWHVADTVFTIPPFFHHDALAVSMKSLLVAIYAVTLLLCGLGASLHSRRNDPRTLIALAAPWVLMFAILPQMHERYFMWGAAIGGVALASSLGMSLMQLLVIGVSLVTAGRPLVDRAHAQLPATFNFISPMHPDIGWMVVLIAAIYLFVAVVPQKA